MNVRRRRFRRFKALGCIERFVSQEAQHVVKRQQAFARFQDGLLCQFRSGAGRAATFTLWGLIHRISQYQFSVTRLGYRFEAHLCLRPVYCLTLVASYPDPDPIILTDREP